MTDVTARSARFPDVWLRSSVVAIATSTLRSCPHDLGRVGASYYSAVTWTVTPWERAESCRTSATMVAEVGMS